MASDPVVAALVDAERSSLAMAVSAQQSRRGLYDLYTFVTNAIIARGEELKQEAADHRQAAADARMAALDAKRERR